MRAANLVKSKAAAQIKYMLLLFRREICIVFYLIKHSSLVLLKKNPKPPFYSIKRIEDRILFKAGIKIF